MLESSARADDPVAPEALETWNKGVLMRTTLLVSFFFGAMSLLPAISFARSGTNAVVTEDEAAYSSSSGSAESPRPPAKPARRPRPSGIGVGVRLSSLGIGGEVAVPVTERSNVRGGFNAFGYSRGFNKDNINYAASLSFRSVEAHYDWYPLSGLLLGGLHLSPGLMLYNGNKVTASASVPGGQTFTLGGTQYTSEPGDPITGSAKLDFNKVAPTVLVGLGNLVPRHRRRFGVNFEVGVAFSGAPQFTMNLKGTACTTINGVFQCLNAATDPTVQSSVAAEQRKVNSDVSAFKVYPVISLGFSYKF
jgi:hypothetical protein